MSTIDLKELCFKVQETVKDVAAFIREERTHFSKDDGIEVKGHSDFVTYVDKASEKKLVEALGKLLPEAGFIAEEGTSSKRGVVYNWVIDPIDGTTNFIHNLPPHAISIGLLRNNDLVLGVVIEITRCELFYTWENAPSYLNGTVIHVSDAQTHNEALVATGFPYYDFGLIENYLNTMRFLMTNTRGIRRLGSAAIDLCYVACGRFDAFWEYGLHPWDMAAGALIIKNAGGKVCAFDKSDNYLFTGKIIATNANYFEEFSNTIVKYQHQ